MVLTEVTKRVTEKVLIIFSKKYRYAKKRYRFREFFMLVKDFILFIKCI
jgi:hypothetical protein